MAVVRRAARWKGNANANLIACIASSVFLLASCDGQSEPYVPANPYVPSIRLSSCQGRTTASLKAKLKTYEEHTLGP